MEQSISLPEAKENPRDIFPMDRSTTTAQEQGYGRKNKTERFLAKNRKQEPKLIGYDQLPIVVPECNDLEALKKQDASPVIKQRSGSKKNSQHSGVPSTGTARSRLYQICAINYWNPPSFDCCKAEGPDHLKLFTFKVTVEMEEASKTVFESFGAPQPSKKAAAEHAAEGALWYLKKKGY